MIWLLKNSISIYWLYSFFSIFYIIFLMFKKWDDWDNKYWKPDNSFLFWKNGIKKRKNIFEYIFYSPIIWPYLKINTKDKISSTSQGRFIIFLYSSIYFTILILSFSIGFIYNWDIEDTFYILFYTFLILIPYPFILPIYFYIRNYIKWE